MFSLLKNHPFAVEAFFEKSIVLTFAMPKESLVPLIPPQLEIDCLNGQYGFMAIALVQTKQLRPKGFPQWLGSSFLLVGYRVFVRYKTSTGKRLRGLYILKSETDQWKMKMLGNLFTHYRYSLTDITISSTGNSTTVTSQASGMAITVEKSNAAMQLPAASPFSSWKEARRFAGPMPFTFSFLTNKNEMLMVEGVRTNWEPVPLHVQAYSSNFLNLLPFKQATLASAFLVENVPYHWKKAKRDVCR